MRSQATLEFLIVVALLLIILLSLLAYLSERARTVEDARARASARQIAFSAAHTLNALLLTPNGTNTTLLLPTHLATGQGYATALFANRLEVHWNNSSEAALLLTRNVSGNLTPGVATRALNVEQSLLLQPT